MTEGKVTEGKGNQLKVTFQKERETKGAIRFQEIDPQTNTPKTKDEEGMVIGTLYFRKTGISGSPSRVEITVTVL